MRNIFYILVLLTFVSLTPQAQEKLTLEDIYKYGEYDLSRFGPARWLENGLGYSTLEASEKYPDALNIVLHNPETDEQSVLVDASGLIPGGKNAPLKISDYHWSADGKKLLIFTNTARVWRYHTRGDYWVLDLATSELTQVGKFADPTWLMFAKFSPDGSRIGYVYRNNIYVEDLNTSEVTQLTFDGSSRFINGTFDWVYEEELDCRDGFRWSPDGKTIAYWHSDTKEIGTFYLINNIDSLYSKPIPFPYPKVGTSNSAVKVGVVSASGGKTKWFDIPGYPQNNYLARMEFIPNSNEVMIQQLNRLQNQNKVWVGSVESMKLDNILTDKDDAFLNIHDNIVWLNNERYFTWTSEKDGWLHLYKVSRDGKEIEPITRGEFDIVNVNCIDKEGGYVYYIAAPESHTERYLYRSPLYQYGEPELISPKEVKGHYSYKMSPNGKWSIATFQNSTTPNRMSLVSLPDHKEVKVLEENSELYNRYSSLKLNPKEFIKIDIGEVVLDAWMIKPIGFDPSKKYPLIFYIYAEPAGSTVQNNWDDDQLWDQYMAQQGYIVMSVDPRGTAVPRGRDWRKSIYRQIGILATHDLAKATKEIIKNYNFIDAERIGTWGWSGGGQMSLNCMFRYPEIYKTGIAVSFVSDQRLYDTIYQERYMGLPSDNAEGYFDGSPINHAYKLEGSLLIIHGTGDDNVHYQSFEMLTNELVKQNKLFSMMSYPMRTHGLSERENTSLHLRRTMENFWKKNLTPGGK